MSLDPLKTSSYDFELPSSLIAKEQVSPRDSSKLLVYDRATKSIIHTFFYNIEKFLPKDCAIIFNNTKVIKARLFGVKPSGGKNEVLINKALDAHNVNVFIRGRVKKDTSISFDQRLSCKVMVLNEDGSRVVNFYINNKLARFEEILPIIDEIGHLPLPPYIDREDTDDDNITYQTVFATQEGAVAAPTASLHFSDELYENVCKNHKHAFVTLHVGSGTFKPVDCEDILEHPMHSEYYDISDEALDIINSDQRLLSVGTTSTRTIEYYVRILKKDGEANLFLNPNNLPKRVNYLLTNFHLPKSTLIMLVSSFIGLEETLKVYEEAINKEYRFYSYGDSMLII